MPAAIRRTARKRTINLLFAGLLSVFSISALAQESSALDREITKECSVAARVAQYAVIARDGGLGIERATWGIGKGIQQQEGRPLSTADEHWIKYVYAHPAVKEQFAEGYAMGMCQGLAYGVQKGMRAR